MTAAPNLTLAQQIARRTVSKLLAASADNDDYRGTNHPASKSLLEFTKATKRDYEVNWHHEIVAGYLDKFVSGEIKRLMIFEPPRHGKSEQVSRRLPAYILGKYPDAGVIACSYSADLSRLFNRDVQRIIDSEEYQAIFPDTKLWEKNIRTVAQDTYLRNSDIFEVVGRRGFYRSSGVGGGITGMGFNYGIIDDPLKNRKEANSITIRDAIWDWYTSTFYTRQEKDAGILITVTRWHLDDLCGRLDMMAEGPDGEQWTILTFPALKESDPTEDDPREIGDPLWPNKYNVASLRQTEQTVGAYDWQSMYQQRPVASTGGLFKRDKFNVIDHEPADIVRRVRFWDPALSAKTSADYTAGIEFGQTSQGRIVILDVRRFQKEWDDVEPEIAKVATADGPRVSVGVESTYFQTRAVKKLMQRAELHAHVIRGIKPDSDKFTRALPFAARVGEGLVDVLRRSWTEGLIDELCSFPMGAHDDQVDACSGAYLMLDKGRPLEVKAVPFA